jgi:hypothetical protein
MKPDGSFASSNNTSRLKNKVEGRGGDILSSLSDPFNRPTN